MNPFKFDVSLRFSGKAIDPAEMRARLGFEPEFQHKIGEQRTTPKGDILEGVYKTSYCCFSYTRRQNEELSEMLARIVESLAQHKDLFSRIRENDGRSEFFIGWYSSKNTGEIFDYELLGKISALGIDLALDVYGCDLKGGTH